VSGPRVFSEPPNRPLQARQVQAPGHERAATTGGEKTQEKFGESSISAIIEGALSFHEQRQTVLRIFISEHK
jgi:hypothetical protein